MALITASLLISSFSILQIVIAYYLLISPSSIGLHSIVMILSASFGLPYNPPSLAEPSALSSLLAAVLVYYSISDLFAANIHEEVAVLYWGSQAPLRLFFFFGLTGWAMLSRPGGLSAIANPVDTRQAAKLSATGPGVLEGGLGNGVVFCWGLLGILSWFWVSRETCKGLYLTAADLYHFAR
jgi:hypothetical protein